MEKVSNMYKIVKTSQGKGLVRESAGLKALEDYYCVLYCISGYNLVDKTIINKASNNFLCNHNIKVS